MDLLSTIMLVLSMAAVIGIILALFGFADSRPPCDGSPAPFDLKPALWLVGSIAVLFASVVGWVMATLWADAAYRPIAWGLSLGIVLLAAICGWHYGLMHALWRAAAPQPLPAQATVNKKPWLSKTIALNALVGVALLAEENVSSLQGLLPASKYQIIAFTLPILNMLLRVYTKQGLSLKQVTPQNEAAE
jgi:hypothetical protein